MTEATPIDAVMRALADPTRRAVFERVAGSEEISVVAQRLPVITLEDLLITKLMALDEHRLDYGSLLPIARALREQIDWAAVHTATASSPFSQAFFTLLRGLEVIDADEVTGAPAPHG